MLILRKFPDLDDRAVQAQYQTQVVREGALVCAHVRRSYYRPQTLGLSIKMAFGGRESYQLDRQWRTVDDDVYLLINGGHDYASRIDATEPVLSIALMFSQDTVRSTVHFVRYGADGALEDPHLANATAEPTFEEHLRPHDAIVSPALKYIARTCEQGLNDAFWYEEQAHFLLERVLRRREADQVEIEQLGKVRRRTRVEIYRRVNRATDYLLSHYDQPLTLNALAEVACLSPHYFLHVFKAVRAHTPFDFLTCKRLAVATRLLARGAETTAQIAEQVGFAGRDRLHRACRRYLQLPPASCRKMFAARQETLGEAPDLRLILSREILQ